MRVAREVGMVLLLLCTTLGTAAAPAQEWTRFRGPNGTGESEAQTVPGSWTEADYNWKTKLPGIGHSSPVIWGERVFLLSADPDNATRHLLCLNAADGKIAWRKDYPSTTHHLHTRSSYASCTPAVDADRVYVAWSAPESTTLKAFSHQGDELWSIDLGTWISQHGFGTSPIVYGESVIVTSSQEPSKLKDVPDPQHSFVVAVDRSTGAIRWKTPRKIDTASYSVPCVYQPEGGRPEILCCSTAEGIFSLDPETGIENWSLPVFTMRTVSSPVLTKPGLVIGTTGSGGGGNYLVALRPGKKPEVAYEVKQQAPYVPTPVCRGDLMFLWSDKGFVTCVDAATGKPYWQQRIGGNYSGSPVRVGDKVYCIDDDGVVVVLAAEKEFKEIGRHPLGEGSRSTPAVAGGRMYLRTYSHLVSIGGKKG